MRVVRLCMLLAAMVAAGTSDAEVFQVTGVN